MTLSIIVPVYNERNTIKEILSAIECANAFGLEKEIIIVDDYSTTIGQTYIREIGGQ